MTAAAASSRTAIATPDLDEEAGEQGIESRDQRNRRTLRIGMRNLFALAI